MFKFLANSEHPSLGPHLYLLGLTGIWQPDQKTHVTRLKMFIFYVIVVFFSSQYIKCIFDLKKESLQLILQYAPFHLGIVKACFFRKECETWDLLINYLSQVERKQIEEQEPKMIKIMQNYIRCNRRVTYFFWALAFFSNFSIFSEPYVKNRIIENGTSIYLHIFDGFIPFSSEPPGYYVSMAIQTILGHVVSAYVIGWDTMVASIMIFFAGQLKIARMYATEVVKPDALETHRNIANCHKFHVELVKYQKTFNGLLSPVMFVYLIVISVNLGVCIIQIVEVQDDLAMLMSSCLFVVACLIQLLLFYWFSNEATEESLKVGYGAFESDWVKCDKAIQKEIHLLGLILSKRLVFKAGPFNEMSLTTFVSILRTSYSFYTLLDKTN
ncbi:odorant receptor 49b-like [Papilio machaon]|uniref:odorant receptor 49b-like n=1 Tax=Papilio machaon TaxID=76193 RepID=UPI001E662B16|nr:odorant receptor 49b-like [Papilio machaon]